MEWQAGQEEGRWVTGVCIKKTPVSTPYSGHWGLYWDNLSTRYTGRCAIHQSILSGSVMACEFLLLNCARIDATDEAGNTALHMAAQLGNTGQVCNTATLQHYSTVTLRHYSTLPQ